MSSAPHFATPLLRLAFVAYLVCFLTVSASLAIDDNLTKGATNNHVFEHGMWGESIDNLNGGLNLTIPLGQEYRVSADVSYQLRLTYSSKIWELNKVNLTTAARSRLGGRGQAGLGFMLQIGRLYSRWPAADCKNLEVLFEDSTGAVHPAGGGQTSDGSYLKVDASSILLPTGVKLLLDHPVNDLFQENNQTLPACKASGSPPPSPAMDPLTSDYRGRYVSRIEGKDRNPVSPFNAYNYVDIEYENSALPSVPT